MQRYGAAPLLHHPNHVVIAPGRNLMDVRFPVQWVFRPTSDEHHDYRGYAGQVAWGVLRPGSDVIVLPSGQRTTIAAIDASGRTRRCLSGDIGDLATRRRIRHLTRRHDRRGRGSADRFARARGDDLLDAREADAPGRAVRDQAHHPRRARS
jgi:hypothetical protein